MQRSLLTRVAFPVLAWGLAFHSLVIAVLFGPLGFPEGLVREIAAWKEMFLVGLVLIVFFRAILGRGPGVSLLWTDFWIGGLFGLAITYLVAGTLLLGIHLPLSVELLGLRQAVFFMLLYFVGRGTPDLLHEGTLETVFVLLLVTSVFGIVERFVIPPTGLVALGVAAYFQDFLGAAVMTVGNDFGLPTNYWSTLGGHTIRRAGSVYLSGQGFAAPFVLFLPLATAWIFWRPKRSVWLALAYVVICVALLLTLTRMTIIVVILQLVLFILMSKRPEWAVGGVGFMALLFVTALALLPGFPTWVMNTLSGKEVSTAGHLTDWSNGALAFIQHPWGFGLGTADQTAARSGLAHITGDNLYLTYAVQLGLFGALLLVLALGSIAGHAMNLFRRATDGPQKKIAAAIWLATIGLLINGMTAVLFSSLTFTWLFFWLAGAVVTASQRVAPAKSPAPLRELTPVTN